jgi:hypothetical protein
MSRITPLRRPALSHRPVIESLESRRLLSGDVLVHVSFQPAPLPLVPGYIADSGAVFGDRGNGFSYGWDAVDTKYVKLKKTKIAPDLRYNTYATMYIGKHKGGHTWSIALPNGTYSLHLVVGDGSSGWRSRIEANGVEIINGRSTHLARWLDNTATVTVSDGVLALSNGPKIHSSKLAFIDIQSIQLAGSQPTPTPTPAPTPTPTPTPNPTLVWQTAATAPLALAEAQGAAANGKLYVMGGYYKTLPSYQGTTRANVYDPATNTWSAIADMPRPITHAGVAAIGSNIWIAGGYPTLPNGQQQFATTDVSIYNTLTNTWSAGPSLPAARGAGVMVAVGSTLRFISGVDSKRVDQTEHWVLDTNNLAAGWTNAASLPEGRNHVAAVVLNNTIYVVGGQLGTNDATGPKSDVFAYHPSTNAWTSVASLPKKRSHITDSTFVWNGKIVVAGGVSTGDHPLADVNIYDPATNAWSTLAALPAPRHSPVVQYAGGKFIATTGYGAGNLQDTTWVSDSI